jgi:glycosidase
VRSFRPTRTAILLTLLCASLPAQTLARKNWAGSGITIEPWYQGAILYQLDPLSFQGRTDTGHGDLQGIILRLDYLQSLGIDALVLSPFQLQPSPSAAPFDPRYGTEEDLDQLIQESSRRKIRIFVDLPLTRPNPDLLSAARFWLSRGVAGLRLTADPHAPSPTPDTLRQLQHLCATYPGGRVLFSDFPQLPVPALTPQRAYRSRHHRTPAPAAPPEIPQLTIDPRLALLDHLDPTTLRSILTPPTAPQLSTPVPATDLTSRPRSFTRLGDGSHNVALAKVLATALLATPGSPELLFGQEIGQEIGQMTGQTTGQTTAPTSQPTTMHWDDQPGSISANVAREDADPDSLLNWYRRLAALRHANPTLRSGTLDLIASTNPDIVAWVRRAAAGNSTAAPVLVVCNLTPRPLLVSASADLRRLGVDTGSGMMHTLATTAVSTKSADPHAAPAPAAAPALVSVSSIALAPYGVFIGELPPQAGLESSPSPLPHSRRSRTSP